MTHETYFALDLLVELSLLAVNVYTKRLGQYSKDLRHPKVFPIFVVPRLFNKVRSGRDMQKPNIFLLKFVMKSSLKVVHFWLNLFQGKTFN